MNRRSFISGLAVGAGAAGVLPLAPRGLGAALPGVLASHRRDVDGWLRLNSNENPLGIAESARRAILEGLTDANRYPFEPRRQLIDALAAMHGVSANHIVLGNGSTEVLQMAVQALGLTGARILVAEPTFEDVSQYAEALERIRVERVPLRADFAHDIERMRDLSRHATGPVLAYLCNPNNPTGTLTPSAEIEAWIAEAPGNVYFLIDEAYYHYVRDPAYRTAVPLVDRHPNLIVARTFSKIYAMAGMRLGYAVAHPETARRIRALASDNNANHLVLTAARACLHDREFIRRSLEVNERSRRILIRCLDELGLEHLPSHANFVMYRINGELRAFIDRMRERGVLVGRPFPPMLGHNRVSIGLPEEMERFAEHLREFRRQGWV